jgi:uncharacterized protein (DUF427 family)
VWDYPRPPDVRSGSELIVVAHGGIELARSTAALRICETSQPPAYYLSRSDIAMNLLVPSATQTFCEWKGMATYWSLRAVVTNGAVIEADDIAWCYEEPSRGFSTIAGRLAFYAQRLDHCSVDGEVVEPNPGSFYGGWITSKVTGPFKGVAGSWGW